MDLLETGLVAHWIAQVFPQLECDTAQAQIGAKQISLEDITSALYILSVGSIFAVCALGVEQIYYGNKTTHQENKVKRYNKYNKY